MRFAGRGDCGILERNDSGLIKMRRGFLRGLKSLSLPIYTDGYNADVSNCWDYSIAGAAGSFDRENYFYYCALYGLCMNYSVENFDQSRIKAGY